MTELQRLLKIRETDVAIDFKNPEHRIRCYAHIINVCSSHIISSMTSVSEEYLSKLKVPYDPDRVFCDDPEDELIESDDENFISDPNFKVDDLELDDVYDEYGDPDLEDWFAGFKRDPLKRARRIIRFLRSSDQRREGFRNTIIDGNERDWFSPKNNPHSVRVPELQLLRDVKTRWDSVYLMLLRLRQLRPVSPCQRLDSYTGN